MSNTSDPYTPAVEGCWFDGARGIYIGEAVIAEAQAKGWDAEEHGYRERDLVCNPEDGDYTDHYYFDATDSAERFLNELVPEGYWIGFNDGDFGMYKAEDNDEGDDEPDDVNPIAAFEKSVEDAICAGDGSTNPAVITLVSELRAALREYRGSKDAK